MLLSLQHVLPAYALCTKSMAIGMPLDRQNDSSLNPQMMPAWPPGPQVIFRSTAGGVGHRQGDPTATPSVELWLRLACVLVLASSMLSGPCVHGTQNEGGNKQSWRTC